MEYERSLFENLPQDASLEVIEATAKRLERHSYQPLLLLEVNNFIRLKKEEILLEYDRLRALSASSPELKAIRHLTWQESVERQLGLLLHHYRLLCRLREGDAEAWDVINELYEDD